MSALLFGYRLREAREAKSLTVADLAKLTGLNWQTIANLEAGSKPSLQTAIKLAEALDVPLGDMVAKK